MRRVAPGAAKSQGSPVRTHVTVLGPTRLRHHPGQANPYPLRPRSDLTCMHVAMMQSSTPRLVTATCWRWHPGQHWAVGWLGFTNRTKLGGYGIHSGSRAYTIHALIRCRVSIQRNRRLCLICCPPLLCLSSPRLGASPGAQAPRPLGLPSDSYDVHAAAIQRMFARPPRAYGLHQIFFPRITTSPARRRTLAQHIR